MSLRRKNPALGRVLKDQLKEIVAAEGLAPRAVLAALEAGSMVCLANLNHADVRATLIGQPARIKVNANIGTSPFSCDVDLEFKKLKAAEAAGAHAVIDLSTAGDLDAIRRKMLARTRLPLGTVPIYAVAQRCVAEGRHPAGFAADELIGEIACQAEQGVDFMTVHCGLTRHGAELATSGGRVLGIVSRGGSILARWMRDNEAENPLLTRYDEILAIARRHNVVLSLGDGLRPGAGADAGDAAQWDEVIMLGILARRAIEAGVQAMIEGPGHVPLHLVQGQIQGIKRATHNAPLYVLGPLVADCAAGYDHIAGAVGGAVAGMAGADFLCYLTPAEHLTLPCLEDVYAGVKASLIAAHAAEVALGRPQAVGRDLAMSQARRDLDWERMEKLAVAPELVRERRKSHRHEKECAMCGKFCAIRMLAD